MAGVGGNLRGEEFANERQRELDIQYGGEADSRLI